MENGKWKMENGRWKMGDGGRTLIALLHAVWISDRLNAACRKTATWPLRRTTRSTVVRTIPPDHELHEGNRDAVGNWTVPPQWQSLTSPPPPNLVLWQYTPAIPAWSHVRSPRQYYSPRTMPRVRVDIEKAMKVAGQAFQRDPRQHCKAVWLRSRPGALQTSDTSP
jgi:hypothetical protein